MIALTMTNNKGSLELLKKYMPPYYEKHDTHGEKLALEALAKKINALQDGDYEGLYRLITL